MRSVQRDNSLESLVGAPGIERVVSRAEPMEEIPLTGGGRTAVVRKGDTVLRETGPWAVTVHALLRHLEDVGCSRAPRVIGSGFDERGREILSYIEGELVHPKQWTEDALPHIGRMIRDIHQATESFSIPANAVWREWHGRRLGNPDGAIGHCDTGPWNIIARDSLPYGLIDWEVAGPVDPIYDLAQACWLNAQLHDDDVAETQGLPPLKDRARHLCLILDGYELPRAQRLGFVDKMIEFAIHDAADEAIEHRVTPETRDPTALWGVTWRTRGASWMLRHRSTLEAALA